MKILNFGSLNIDYTYQVDHVVQEGETITSPALEIFPGGKGLNQTIALAKAGSDVWHAGLIGEDGRFLRDLCAEAGAHVDYLRESEVRSGNAIIQVTPAGNNCIIVFPGSNRQITEGFIDEVLAGFEAGDVIVLQNEVNLLNVIIDKAFAKGMKIVLNPSPFDHFIGECDLTKVSLFMINEIEGKQLTGLTEPEAILAKIAELYPNAAVVLTLGEDGSMFAGAPAAELAGTQAAAAAERVVVRQNAIPTKAVDTTAAGDTFSGYFLTAWLSGKTPAESLKIASVASSIAVARKGASISIPVREEVERALV